MGRLKRSCVVGSIVFHALTLALLVLAPVLLAKRVEKVQVINLIPSEIVDQIMAPPAPVSYTHLRAHETLRYLVCRLLLEK